MRLLALGDTQLGVQTVTLESQAQVLDRIAEVAVERDADLVLHGGDVFEGRGSHGNVITPEQLDVFRAFVAKLRQSEIPVLAISGNGVHDSSMRSVNGLAIFDEIPGITISSRPFVYNFSGCNVVTLPWVSPARMIAEANGSIARDRVNEEVAARLVDVARFLLSPEVRAMVNPKVPNILLLHWSISGASLPTGLPVDQLHEPVLEWAELDALGFDCVIASHVHKAQRLDKPELGDATLGVYTGSPQPLNHGEAGYEHGVWLVDVEPGAVSLEFIEIESPQFITIEADEVMLANGPWLRTETLEGDIVRVRYTATREEDATIDKDAIRRELVAAGASRVTIEPQITREVRARVETLTQDLSETAALALYAEAQGIEAGMAERMRVRLREWIA